MIDGAVCPGDCGLDVSQRGVDPFEGWRSRRRGSGDRDHDLMRTTGVGDTAEAPQSVADQNAIRPQAGLCEARNQMAAKTGDTPQLQANWLALGRGFDGGDERCLARRPTSALAAATLAAEIGVVDLDPPG
jgi:hypothetical protein